MRTPILSVGMPVRNGARYLRRAIESVLAQNFDDWEIVISDNASTDGTAEICAEFAARDPRIRYIRQEGPVNVAANFRCVYEEARGRYFMWLACDDSWRPGFFERAVAVLDSDPEVSLVFSHLETYNWASGSCEERQYVVSAHGTPRTRFVTRVLNPVPNALYGMFRKTETIPIGDEPMDFGDILFTQKMAILGETRIIDEHLFVAGIRQRLQPIRPAEGPRFRYVRYWRAVVRLIDQHFRGWTKWILLLLVARQTLHWMRLYRSSGPEPALAEIQEVHES